MEVQELSRFSFDTFKYLLDLTFFFLLSYYFFISHFTLLPFYSVLLFFPQPSQVAADLIFSVNLLFTSTRALLVRKTFRLEYDGAA